MIAHHHQSLPVVRVADIVTEENPQRWLIDQLWGASAVGVIGGAPKCSKTWLALDMSLSVATGTACLDRYEVPDAGPVLVYLAEDSLPIVRERVEGIARHRDLRLDSVPLHVITAPVLRLDREPHRTQLLETARQLRPRLLLLDPLVRLHQIDENRATEVAELLAYFRSLQRDLDVSVVLVHHTRKNAAGGAAAGVGLRGSGDIHAFGDSNLYLRRCGDRFMLSSEHRAAAAAQSLRGDQLVREDGLSQVEAAQLLGRHKSWVNRRLAMLERLSDAAREELRLGLLTPSLARQLTRLPRGNQAEALKTAREASLTSRELSAVVDLLLASSTQEQTAFVLSDPRRALRQADDRFVHHWDPRLSVAGNRVAKRLALLLDSLWPRCNPGCVTRGVASCKLAIESRWKVASPDSLTKRGWYRS